MKKFKSGNYLILVDYYDREGYEPCTPYLGKFSTFDSLLFWFGKEDLKSRLEEDLGRKVNQQDLIEEIEYSNGDGSDFIRVYYINKNNKLLPFIGVEK